LRGAKQNAEILLIMLILSKLRGCSSVAVLALRLEFLAAGHFNRLAQTAERDDRIDRINGINGMGNPRVKVQSPKSKGVRRKTET
jgi:hypothetical protein